MVTEQLLSYIKEQIEQGISKEEIKNKLMANGWQEADVNEALALVFGSTSVSQPPEQQQMKGVVEISPVQKLKIGLIKIIIGIFIIIILGGMGITLASRIWDPLWNPFRPSPEKVIAQMAKKISEIKTIHNDINFELDLKDIKNKIEFGIKGNIQTDSDTTDQQNPKSKAVFNGSWATSLAARGTEFSLGLETIQIGETTYIKITTIPLDFQLFLALIGINFEQLENQWIKFDKESSIQFLEQFLLRKKGEEELEKKQEEEKKEQEKMIEKLRKIIENKKLYIVKKQMADQKIGDKKAYHYLVALNNEEVKKILPELFKAMEGSEKFLSRRGVEEIFPELDEFFGKIGEITAEIWIGKKDNYLYRFKGEKTLDLNQFDKERKGTISIKLEINFSQFNQPLKIEAPEEYKTLGEIFKLRKEFFQFPSLEKEEKIPEEFFKFPPLEQQKGPFMLKNWQSYLKASILEIFRR